VATSISKRKSLGYNATNLYLLIKKRQDDSVMCVCEILSRRGEYVRKDFFTYKPVQRKISMASTYFSLKRL
jgi:hypothetical protein